jgi:hypothetical protein
MFPKDPQKLGIFFALLFGILVKLVLPLYGHNLRCKFFKLEKIF